MAVNLLFFFCNTCMDVYVHNKFLADVIKHAVCGGGALCGLEKLMYLQLVFQYRHFFIPNCFLAAEHLNMIQIH